MLFGNNGRPSTADKIDGIEASHIEAVSNKTFSKEFVYVGDRSRIENCIFDNCKVTIEETSSLRNCIFNNCVIEKGECTIKVLDKSLSKDNRNKFTKCISLDASDYEVGIDAELLPVCYGSSGRTLRKAAYRNDFDIVLRLSEELDIDRKYIAHKMLIESNDKSYRLGSKQERIEILMNL